MTAVLLSFINHFLDLGKSASLLALQVSRCWMLSEELRSVLRWSLHSQNGLGRNANVSGTLSMPSDFTSNCHAILKANK
jgi:hypothetical protein